jgi:rubrerythrin
MSKTEENLRKALAHEADAHVRYVAFARRAAEEGFAGVDLLFRAASLSERVHAQSHQAALGADPQILEGIHSSEQVNAAVERLFAEGVVKSTLENLKNAIEEETFEFNTFYPMMIQTAAAEKMMDARYSLEYAMSIEMVHAKLFKKMMADPAKNDVEAYFVCPVCGHTTASQAPRRCPYCGVDAAEFHEVR